VTKPRAPEGARAAGRRLWRSIVDEFELDEHELALLRQAVRVVDTIDALQAVVDRDGVLTVEGKTHPAVVELRQQRLVLARLIVALRVPIGEGESKHSPVSRLQRRGGVRGVYGPRAVS
jgi:hypothetical protein